MRKTGILFSIMTILIFSNTAFALLEDNGDGTITQTRNDGSVLMWLKDTGLGGRNDWNSAMAWADTLVYAGYDDWRLPATLPINGSNYIYGWSNDGSSDDGRNITSSNSEMSYMFYGCRVQGQACKLTFYTEARPRYKSTPPQLVVAIYKLIFPMFNR